MISEFFVLVLIQVLFAQNISEVTPLTDGVPFTGSIASGLSSSDISSYNPHIYTINVPINAKQVNISIIQRNCPSLILYLKSDGYPCSDFNLDNEYACTLFYSENIYGNFSDTFGPSFDSNLFQWEVGRPWYIGVGLRSYFYPSPTNSCTYDITVGIDKCDAGQVSLYNSFLDREACRNVTNVATFPTTLQFNSEIDQVMMLTVPANTAQVKMHYQSNSNRGQFFGENYAAPSYYDNRCSITSYTSYNNSLRMYLYDLICYLPRTGSYMIYLTDDDTTSASFTVDLLVCPTGTAGYNCTSAAIPYSGNSASAIIATNPATNSLVTSTSFTTDINCPSTSIGYSGGYSITYVYVDLDPSNSSQQIFTVSAKVNHTGYIVYRKDGFSEYSDIGYESSSQYRYLPSSFSFSSYDFAVPGRIFFALVCYSPSYSCTFTVNTTILRTPTSITYNESNSFSPSMILLFLMLIVALLS